MSPKPEDISCLEALQNPNKNRSNRYLPGMRYTGNLCCVNLKHANTGDVCRVILRGDQDNYINAVYVNVSLINLFILYSLTCNHCRVTSSRERSS